MLPKVQFKLPTVKREAEMFVYFCTPRKTGWDWSARIYENHPALKDVLKDKQPKELRACAYKYANNFIKQHKTELKSLVARYQKEWDVINDEYLKILSEHFETDYPNNRKIIRAYVSIIPIFPRFLDKWAFNVGSKKPQLMIPISMHEILHFLYFKKWMEVFPETKRKELDSPYLVWKLSEILDPIILNNNKDIQRLSNHTHGHYAEFQKIKIGRKTMIAHFEDIYKKHLKSNESFEDFLKTCWGEALKYRKIIEQI